MGRDPLCMVACVHCSTSGPTMATEGQAIAAWNHRSVELQRTAVGQRPAEKTNLRKVPIQDEMLALERRRKYYAQYERQPLTTPLRFDGLYKSTRYQDAGDGRRYWNYLQFFRGGLVLGVCMSGEARECMHWLEQKHESGDLSRGRYRIIGSTIRFTTYNSTTTVQYRGLVLNQALELEYLSQKNGSVGIIDFLFIAA